MGPTGTGLHFYSELFSTTLQGVPTRSPILLGLFPKSLQYALALAIRFPITCSRIWLVCLHINISCSFFHTVEFSHLYLLKNQDMTENLKPSAVQLLFLPFQSCHFKLNSNWCDSPFKFVECIPFQEKSSIFWPENRVDIIDQEFQLPTKP
jgi:hypothetical protein